MRNVGIQSRTQSARFLREKTRSQNVSIGQHAIPFLTNDIELTTSNTPNVV